MTINRYGKAPARVSVLDGMRAGLTCKETAFEYDLTIRAVQEAARRLGLSFIYSGYGRRPKYPQGKVSIFR